MSGYGVVGIVVGIIFVTAVAAGLLLVGAWQGSPRRGDDERPPRWPGT